MATSRHNILMHVQTSMHAYMDVSLTRIHIHYTDTNYQAIQPTITTCGYHTRTSSDNQSKRLVHLFIVMYAASAAYTFSVCHCNV